MTRLTPTVLVLGLFGVIGFSREAAAQAAACKPVTDAMLKVATTPHHTVSKRDGSNTSESIVVDNTTYVEIKGVWHKSPVTPPQQLAQEQENIKAAKVYTCMMLRAETVNGVAANAYKVHSESDAGVSDGTVWVAPSLGVPVKTEEDITPSMGPKMHLSITWDYVNIHAPVLVSAAAWRVSDQAEKTTSLPLHSGLTFQQKVDASICGHKAQMNIYDAPGTATLAEYVSWYRSQLTGAHYVHKVWSNRAQEMFYSADGMTGVSMTGSVSGPGVFAVTYMKMSAPLTTKQMDAFGPANTSCK